MGNQLLEHPRVDLVAAAVGFGAWWLTEVTIDRGIGIAGAVAGVAGALLGMTAVVMGLYEAGNARVRALADANRTVVTRNWAGILMHFAAASVIALGATFIPVVEIQRSAIGYAVLLTGFSTIRLGWFLRTYFAVSNRKQKPDAESARGIHW